MGSEDQFYSSEIGQSHSNSQAINDIFSTRNDVEYSMLPWTMYFDAHHFIPIDTGQVCLNSIICPS